MNNCRPLATDSKRAEEEIGVLWWFEVIGESHGSSAATKRYLDWIGLGVFLAASS